MASRLRNFVVLLSGDNVGKARGSIEGQQSEVTIQAVLVSFCLPKLAVRFQRKGQCLSQVTPPPAPCASTELWPK